MATWKSCPRCGSLIRTTGRDRLCPDCRSLFIQLEADRASIDPDYHSSSIDYIPSLSSIADLYDQDIDLIADNLGYSTDLDVEY